MKYISHQLTEKKFVKLTGITEKVYFTRAYNDRPYFQYQTNDGKTPTVTLTKKSGSAFASYVGASISGVSSSTRTVIAFYCTVPDETEDEEDTD